MGYPQDLVGKIIRGSLDKGESLEDQAPRPVADGLLPGRAKWRSLPVHGDTPAVPPGHQGPGNAYRNWEFTFLQYVGGAVTATPLLGSVLTGPMTGCYLFRYTQAGTVKVAHVGTVNLPSNPHSVAAKGAWLGVVARDDVSGVAGADPAEYYSAEEQALALAEYRQFPYVAGYFDWDGSAYALLLIGLFPDKKPEQMKFEAFKLLAVKPMTLRPWGDLAGLPTFQLPAGTG